jgi:hypothetical protein
MSDGTSDTDLIPAKVDRFAVVIEHGYTGFFDLWKANHPVFRSYNAAHGSRSNSTPGNFLQFSQQRQHLCDIFILRIAADKVSVGKDCVRLLRLDLC